MGSNYPFLTSKERDNETGLDYFLARYYSSPQGRFTSPDEFTGGPDELYEESPSTDPLLYADPSNPQSLNKYHYAFNNPLRYVDPDGHQGLELVKTLLSTSPVTDRVEAVGTGVKDVAVGAGKSVANVGVGINNFSSTMLYGPGTWDDGVTPVAPSIKPFEPSNDVQAIAMHATDVGLLISPLAGKAGPTNVIAAQSKQTTVAAAQTTEQMAGELSAQIGKNSVSYTTPNKVGHGLAPTRCCS